MGWISFIFALKRSSVSSSLKSEKSFTYLLLLPLFCIMFIYLILLCFPPPCFLLCTLETQLRVNPFTVCCILSSQRGRKTLIFCNSAKKSIFWGRTVLAMCAGSSGWVWSLALHWYFICPTTSRNAACTKQCHSFKYFHSYHLQTSVYLWVLQRGTSNR